MTGLLVEESPMHLQRTSRSHLATPRNQQPITVLFEGSNSGRVTKAVLSSSTTISQIQLKVLALLWQDSSEVQKFELGERRGAFGVLDFMP